MIWRVEPSLSGYHYWSLHHLRPMSPTSSQPPMLSNSVHTVRGALSFAHDVTRTSTYLVRSNVCLPSQESQFGGRDVDTPTSSVPTSPWVGSFANDPHIEAVLSDGAAEQGINVNAIAQRGRGKEGRSPEKDPLYFLRTAQLQAVCVSSFLPVLLISGRFPSLARPSSPFTRPHRQSAACPKVTPHSTGNGIATSRTSEAVVPAKHSLYPLIGIHIRIINGPICK